MCAVLISRSQPKILRKIQKKLRRYISAISRFLHVWMAPLIGLSLFVHFTVSSQISFSISNKAVQKCVAVFALQVNSDLFKKLFELDLQFFSEHFHKSPAQSAKNSAQSAIILWSFSQFYSSISNSQTRRSFPDNPSGFARGSVALNQN